MTLVDVGYNVYALWFSFFCLKILNLFAFQSFDFKYIPETRRKLYIEGVGHLHSRFGQHRNIYSYKMKTKNYHTVEIQ